MTFPPRLAVIACVLLICTGTAIVQADQEYSSWPPHLPESDVTGHPEEEKVIHDGEDSEFVNPLWVGENRVIARNAAQATGVATPWIVKSWWHRINFDETDSQVGPYTGDADWDEDLADIVNWESNKMHYSFCSPGLGAKTSILAIGTINSLGRPGNGANGQPLLGDVTRRGKDQSILWCGIENIDDGYWKFDYTAALKMKAGADARIDPASQLFGSISKVDSSAYGRIRAWLDDNLLAVEDAEVRRTNLDVEFGESVNIETQYGTREGAGFYGAVTDSWGWSWDDIQDNEDYFVSNIDFVQIDDEAVSEAASAKFVYSSYASVHTKVVINDGSGVAFARVGHGRMKINESGTYSKFRENDEGENQDELVREYCASTTPWEIVADAYEIDLVNGDRKLDSFPFD
ncbi:MAG: hypothetical protein R3E76_09810 [Planctomycetota bacterium]